MTARRLALLLAGACLLLGAAGLKAATSIVSDRSAWAARAGVVGTESYEGYAWNQPGGDLLTTGGAVALGTLRYVTGPDSRINGIGTAVTFDAAYLSGNYLEWQSQSAGMAELSISFPFPVASVGFDIGQFYGAALPFTVTLDNGESFDLETRPEAYRFVGLVSDRLFYGLTLTAPAYPAIDNLAWGLAHPSASPGSVRLALNPGGPGHVLIIPYFSTQAGNATLINIVNSDEAHGKAVKLRFRGASNGDALFDFQLFLSPGDVWSANVSTGPNGLPRLMTSNASCTLPASVAADFATDRLNTVELSGDALANEAREGYVEIMTMGDIPPDAEDMSLWQAIQHDDRGTAPCTAAVLASLTQGDLRMRNPTTGLMANWVIINVPNTTTWSGEAVTFEARLQGLPAEGRNVFWPQTETPLSLGQIQANTADPLFYGRMLDATSHDLPDLSTPYTTSVAAPIVQATTLSDALAAITLASEYLSDPGVQASTDWIISQPTRRYYAAVRYAGATPGERLITNYNQFGLAAADYYRSRLTNDAQVIPAPDYYEIKVGNMLMGNAFYGCQVWQGLVFLTQHSFWDREGMNPRPSSPIATPQPLPPPVLCGVVSVFSMNSPVSPVGASVSRVDLTIPPPLPASSGWWYLPKVPLIDGWGRLTGFNPLDVFGGGNLGYPMLASQFTKATNPAVAPGVSGTFGAVWKARVVRPGKFAAP